MAGKRPQTPPADAWEMWGDDPRYERNRVTGDFRLNASPWAQDAARLEAQARREAAGLRRAPITQPLRGIAMSVSSKAEGEASRKGLTGPAKRQYVGGAINRAKHEKAESATPASRAKKQQHAYHREATADARAQIRYHEAQIAGLREGVQLRRELAGPSKKRAPKPKGPPSLMEQQRAAGLVPKTPLDILRKTPVRKLTDQQLLRDWENHPPERRRGTLEREMARRQAKAEKAKQPPTTRPLAKAAKAAKPAGRHGKIKPEGSRIKLTPIRTISGYQLDATRRLDPYDIRENFGASQTPTALSIQTVGNLSGAVDVVQERTGRKYTGSRKSRQAMYDWILENM